MSSKLVTIESIESVYRKRGADLFRLALARTSDPERARDAVQESFARAIRARTGFRGSGSLETWICRCVLNATSDTRRPVGEYALHEADTEGVGWKPATTDADVRAAVRRLPARQRDVLFLRFYLDYDYLTIVETLGIETETVSATLHAARKNLTRALEEATR
ncbi:MAG: sigma-70 family RNA polymerase sigma factor [Gaiellaceae bacterium]